TPPGTTIPRGSGRMSIIRSRQLANLGRASQMRKTLFTLGICCLAATPLRAQLHPDSVFQRLLGHWVLRGTIGRQATTHDLSFEWMIGHEYLRMHEVSRERDAKGAPQYEAVVLFVRDPKTGEYVCQWMDNTAVTAFDPAGIGRGRVSGD